jgi:MATE family multidrug resistance protein
MVFSYIYFGKKYTSTWKGKLAILFYYLLTNNFNQLKHNLITKGWSSECLYDWKMYLKLAIPGLLTLLIEWSSFQMGIFASASIDNDQLALMTIGQQVVQMSYQFPFGIAIAANIYIGQLLGSREPEAAKNAARVAYTLTCNTQS